MIVHERRVKFEEVDAAQIVFFARFLNYCHDAMEALLDRLEGGTLGLIRDRKLGLPTVHIECDYLGPLRYGDVAVIQLTTEKLGKSSATLHYDVFRKADGAKVATAVHVIVASDLVTMKTVALPDDLRAQLQAQLRA